LKAFERHQQLEHYECDNCFKFFSYENLENHKEVDEHGNKTCKLPCLTCGDNPLLVFNSGETYVDHMNEKHRSVVGVNWFQCVHCLKLNKRYFNRYYPTKRSLQLHLASLHGQQNQTSGQRVLLNPVSESTTTTGCPVKIVQSKNINMDNFSGTTCTTLKTTNNELPILSSYNPSTLSTTSEIYVPINTMQGSTATDPANTVLSSSPNQIVNNQLINNQLTNQLTTTADDQGQQIIQQFQIQLPDHQNQLVDQQTQQIQIIQSDPNNPEQPQVITLYTWGGNSTI